jgi:hypothetical protein
MSPQVIYKIESMLYNTAGTISAVLFKLNPKEYKSLSMQTVEGWLFPLSSRRC